MKRQNTMKTRQHTKRITKILSVALILALTLTTLVLPASAVTNPFKDVPSNQYYYEPVLWAVGKGITNGTSATTFSPNQKCTRAQAVMFLWNAAGKPEPASNSNPFKDVPTNQYYYKAVLWAVGKGITSGTSKTEFSPNQGCTRGQIMTFVWRYAGMPSGAGTANPFKDVPTNQYYYQPVLWAVGKGITNGTSTTTFSPNQTCTRGQIMTFLYNYEVKVKNAAGGQQKPTPTPTPKPTPTPTPKPTPTPEQAATAWGFSYPIISVSNLYMSEYAPQKFESNDTRDSNGSHKYSVEFCSNGGMDWINSVQFKVEDVTPTAYKNMYQTMGEPAGITGQTVSSVSINYFNSKIIEPCDNSTKTPVKHDVDTKSAVRVDISANIATRVVKVTAMKDGNTLDTIYACSSLDCPQDTALRNRVRRIAENKLWTSGMTIPEKFFTMTEYLCHTTRYPHSDAVSKDLNSEYWKDWSVDGIELYENLTDDYDLNYTMVFQGGTGTCSLAYIMADIAEQDLGLKNLYVNGKIQDTGEGFYVGVGAESSSPNNPSHMTFWYRDSSGKKTPYDVAGMTSAFKYDPSEFVSLK